MMWTLAAASLLLAMNQSADPCQDFFQFACGTWNKKHLIPEDRSSISTFEVLFDQLQIILKGKCDYKLLRRFQMAYFVSRIVTRWYYLFHAIIDLLQEETVPEDNETTIKAKLFYNSCMNTSESISISQYNRLSFFFFFTMVFLTYLSRYSFFHFPLRTRRRRLCVP